MDNLVTEKAEGVVNQATVAPTTPVQTGQPVRNPAQILKSITITNGANYGVGQNYQIDGTGTYVDEWYKTVYPGWYIQYPGYAMWTQTRYVDCTERAMKIAKELMDKKLVAIKNVSDFINLVDIIRKNMA